MRDKIREVLLQNAQEEYSAHATRLIIHLDKSIESVTDQILKIIEKSQPIKCRNEWREEEPNG